MADEIDHAHVKAGKNGGPDTILIVARPSPAEHAISAVGRLAVNQPKWNYAILVALLALAVGVAWLAWSHGAQLDRIEHLIQEIR